MFLRKTVVSVCMLAGFSLSTVYGMQSGSAGESATASGAALADRQAAFNSAIAEALARGVSQETLQGNCKYFTKFMAYACDMQSQVAESGVGLQDLIGFEDIRRHINTFCYLGKLKRVDETAFGSPRIVLSDEVTGEDLCALLNLAGSGKLLEAIDATEDPDALAYSFLGKLFNETE